MLVQEFHGVIQFQSIVLPAAQHSLLLLGLIQQPLVFQDAL